MESKFMLFNKKPIIAADIDKWELIAEIKNDFIKYNKIPQAASYLPREVIDSWILSKRNGIDWQSWPPANLNEDELNAVLEDNRQLIETACISMYSPLLEESGYNMLLYDSCGIILDYALIRPEEIISIGGNRRESVVGTTAHNLAARHRCAVQIIGAVNYCTALESNITSSAPIFNEYGELLGTVVLYQKKALNLYNLSHNLGWITSVAMAISSKLRLQRRDIRLSVMDGTLKATIGYSKDILISIDNSGHIINYNNGAAKLLKLEGKPKSLFFDMVMDPFFMKKAVKRGESFVNRRMIFKNNPDKIFNADMTSFANGAVIKISVGSTAAKKDKINFEDIIHESDVMRSLIHTAKLVSKNPINILLQGESGTGKELFAQAIHNYCGRGPFVAINCASIPASLIESELFGYEKGAFTGAEKEGRKGRIEYANGGTLFLDEIGDMPLELQPVLLRVLEEKKVTRVGGHKSIPVDFRIISATNKFLYEGVKNGVFRGDLYFRLSVVNLEIPPLRERGRDVIMLAEYFIEKICDRFGLHTYSLTGDAENALMSYSWPGNVRQLENAMIYAVSFAKKDTIKSGDLPKEILSVSDDCRRVMKEIENMQAEAVKNAIDNSKNMEEAAKRLGISRSTLYRRLRKR